MNESLPSTSAQNVLIKHNYYRDSLDLLRLSDEIKRYPGILDASIVMGTTTNKEILIKLGFPSKKISQAENSDMIVALRARGNDVLLETIPKIEDVLRGVGDEKNISARKAQDNPDLESVLHSFHDINIALLSIPGEYVKGLSIKLINEGIHQQIFSDHVSLEDELHIKKHAVENGVLILGPGAGTSIINGKCIGFSNAVTVGPVAIVAAAGTGLQEVSTLLDHCGIGVKHGLGVGGNDPKEEIGGLMMSESLKMLEKCDDIDVINIVSKPPSPRVQQKIIDYVMKYGGKKYVMTFIGGIGSTEGSGMKIITRIRKPDNKTMKIIMTNTLTSSVFATARQISNGKKPNRTMGQIYISPKDLANLIKNERKNLNKNQKYLRALYTGGTFAYETQVILNGIGITPLYSNAPLFKSQVLRNSMKSKKNSVIDLGEEEFTRGRAHPMIDPTIRKLRLLEDGSHDDVAVIILDFVLGYGSNADPVASIIDEIKKIKAIALENNRHLSIIGHVCGTIRDPQSYERSITILKNADVHTLPTNAFAAIAAAGIVAEKQIDLGAIYSTYIGVTE